MANFLILENAIQKLQSATAPELLDNIVEKAATRQLDFIPILNRRQLLAGKRSTGMQIGKYASYTKRLKRAKGQRTDHMTLKDTGDFHNSIKAKVFGSRITVYATDIKADYLTGFYGEDILGLSDYNLLRIRRLMRPLIMIEVRAILRRHR